MGNVTEVGFGRPYYVWRGVARTLNSTIELRAMLISVRTSGVSDSAFFIETQLRAATSPAGREPWSTAAGAVIQAKVNERKGNML